MGVERPNLPDWARRDREDDKAWIHENLHVFWPLGRELFREHGRGAFVVDTTFQPRPDAGHPFSYFPKEQLDKDDTDVMRMVREYKPAAEFVIVLLKQQERQSSYRVRAKRRGLRSNGH